MFQRSEMTSWETCICYTCVLGFIGSAIGLCIFFMLTQPLRDVLLPYYP